MPTYSTKCVTCRKETDVRLSYSEYDAVKDGTRTLACSCGSQTEIVFSPVGLGFSLKDGESGGWASKAMVENAYRAKRSSAMARRERDNVFKPRLVPNYGGAEAPTWKDAQEAARADKGEVAAVTYDPLVGQEK